MSYDDDYVEEKVSSPIKSVEWDDGMERKMLIVDFNQRDPTLPISQSIAIRILSSWELEKIRVARCIPKAIFDTTRNLKFAYINPNSTIGFISEDNVNEKLTEIFKDGLYKYICESFNFGNYSIGASIQITENYAIVYYNKNYDRHIIWPVISNDYDELMVSSWFN